MAILSPPSVDPSALPQPGTMAQTAANSWQKGGRGFRPNPPADPAYIDKFRAEVDAATPAARTANGMDPKTGAPIPGWQRPAPAAPVGPQNIATPGASPAAAPTANAPLLPPAFPTAKPTSPAAPLLPPVATAAKKPSTFGPTDFRNQPFGTGMNGEKPLVAYQGSQGNGAPQSFRPMNPGDSGPPSPGPAMSEGDFVASNMADASPSLGGRHHDRIRTGKFRGKLFNEAVQSSRAAYAGMGGT